MKKKSTSQSAFFNPRFLIGAFVALAGISLALFATANPVRPTAAQAQQKYKLTTQSSIDRNFTPTNISIASVSTPGGTPFTPLTKPNAQSPFDNTFRDPVVLYHKPSGTWVTVWLDGACGGQGLGGYKSITPDAPNSCT